ncbi:hypothetical protein ACRXCV_00300 (plasmid) [Halobacteriovorax sp. GFR7]|uniref:deoxynucleotide monophosphate kinase family protein n=1 Tax=unclassified Halobacteriovorax TaxID=2639665 RepID=UPI003D952537
MILGFTGLKRCGKDTAASYILEKYGAEQVMLADPIKRALMTMFGFTWEQVNGEGYDREQVIPEYGVSIRHMLQTLGTEWGRMLINPDIWVRLQAERLEHDKLYVMSDVRFENEAELCRQNGILIHVRNLKQSEVVDHHKSEDGVEFAQGDIILNNKMDGLRQFHNDIEAVLTHLREDRGWKQI